MTIILYLFKLLHTYQLRVNLIQNSAISFSVCVDNSFNHFDQFYDQIKLVFKASFIKGVDLYTVRHFTKGFEVKYNEMCLFLSNSYFQGWQYNSLNYLFELQIQSKPLLSFYSVSIDLGILDLLKIELNELDYNPYKHLILLQEFF